MVQSLASRFWPKVDVRGPNECWPWRAEHSHNPHTGRGSITVVGFKNKVNSTRVTFFLAHGRWPVVARHTCDNPPCCNPDHIIDGTRSDNMQDSLKRDRFNHGSRGRPGNNAKVSAEQVREIRQAAQSGETYVSIARRYSVSNVQIRNIVTRKSWTHVQ